MRLSYANVMSSIAVFVALGTGGAYAANTIRGSDIVDNEVSSADVRDDTLGFGGLAAQDLGPGSVGSSEVKDFSLGNADLSTGSVDGQVVLNGSLGEADIGPNAVGTSEVAFNSLNGDDIDESSLDLHGATTAKFAGTPSDVTLNTTMTKVIGQRLPAGSWLIVATANLNVLPGSGNADSACELRNGSGYIGGAIDRRTFASAQARVSLSMNGGAQLPDGGGEVSLWCRDQYAAAAGAQLMMIRVGSFS